MSKQFGQFSRRCFLKTSAGAVGATIVGGLGCTTEDGMSAPDAGGDAASDGVLPPENITLFTGGKIGAVTLKNRLIRSATEEAYCHIGAPQPKYIEVMTDLALGGVGMIISGVATLTEEDSLSFELAAFDDEHIAGLEQVRAEVRKTDNDCRLFAQIGHTGHRYYGETRIGPSDVSWPGDTKPMRALSIQEIEEIVDAFAQGTRRFKEAGWDGVEIHGGHAYLISSFLSPYTNKRTDRYGGSLQGRVQILNEIMEKTRTLVGADFPVMIKVNSDDRGGTEPDDLKGGITEDIFLETAEEIEKMSFDALDVSGNDCVKPSVNDPDDQSYFFNAAHALDVAMPVILTGGNRSVSLLDDILQTGEVDFLGVSRPLIREPDLPNKWLSGETTKTKCISCNMCTQMQNLMTGLRCHQES